MKIFRYVIQFLPRRAHSALACLAALFSLFIAQSVFPADAGLVSLIKAVFTPPAANTITLDPATRYQVMSGWEATSQAGQSYSAAWSRYKDALFDRAAGEVG
ncbi:MAG TPA: hypothetical protein VHL50_06685, partial [Pyrinomonadaceae bacterium]|nr:hypothetical protein [Pyrinomonadaceae bacterium]